MRYENFSGHSDNTSHVENSAHLNEQLLQGALSFVEEAKRQIESNANGAVQKQYKALEEIAKHGGSMSQFIEKTGFAGTEERAQIILQIIDESQSKH